jgi:hypothetical protein
VVGGESREKSVKRSVSQLFSTANPQNFPEQDPLGISAAEVTRRQQQPMTSRRSALGLFMSLLCSSSGQRLFVSVCCKPIHRVKRFGFTIKPGGAMRARNGPRYGDASPGASAAVPIRPATMSSIACLYSRTTALAETRPWVISVT